MSLEVLAPPLVFSGVVTVTEAQLHALLEVQSA